MSGEAQLEALLEIINASARQAIAEYKKGGNDVPTIRSKTYHPLDFATDTVSLKKAVRLLEGACQQLCASLAPPQHTVCNYAMSFQWACVDVAHRAKVADVLEKFPEGLHVDELAKLVNLEKGKLSRVLRLLATKGCFIEVAPNIFANNRLSLVILSNSDSGALSRMATEHSSRGAVVLYATMTDPEYAKSGESDKAPIVYALKKAGFKGNFSEWIRQDVDRHADYHRAMRGISYASGSLSVLHHYPWNDVNTVCDVGASVGTVSIPLSKAYPHLKIVDQDLPDVMTRAKYVSTLSRVFVYGQVWARDAPEALQDNRVEFVSLNFLEGSPVQGQDVYYLRNIIHSWDDAEAMLILRNVRKAMALHSRLLIHDYVVVPASHDPNAKSFGMDVAPEPMLPNFGDGSNRMYQQDLTMWFLRNAKERTLDDLIALGLATSLRLEKVYDLAESSVMEFRLDA